ncbi:unnamed protein product [Brassica rapa]|uniref:BnaA02g21670D protein n=2 Tax=Brassica TaxID=3705 RepID=A0A078GJ42_BRANA|nr:unnamed protein product [Brassica rapa]CDY25289.1 BnaA02g21670D [Brassica napus]VDC90028.1 unnamed protein product [Brassica rapa]
MHYIPISFTNRPPNKTSPLCILLIRFNCKKAQDGDHNLWIARHLPRPMEKLRERGAELRES